MKTFDDYFGRFPTDIRAALDGCVQDPIWHNGNTVTQHLRAVWREIDARRSGDPFLRAVCLFHDIAKPETRTERIDQEGRTRVSHIRHETLVDPYIDRYFDLFPDLTGLIDKLRVVCRLHMRSHQYRNGQLKKPAKREAFEKLPEFGYLMAFAECDEEGK